MDSAPNIVNVATITGVTTFHAGISTIGGGNGITTVVSNAAASGKVLKINSLTAAAIGSTTGVTLNYLIMSIMPLLGQQYHLVQQFRSNFLIIGSN